ncbi:DUF2752 domain-containing protein [Nocardioides anomalus]|uniref:DUF2752 domain-containing protein n=1 Tax=Nocardioides anomalus TaxID=2712223 RepID=A0A6G6WB99_9ACTN|nr:DUF2752 domain-containing protein [Nocardioides anomalus]QIG42621.1 DUF2752 domain-containing protein [Nocardioides anomalus]
MTTLDARPAPAQETRARRMVVPLATIGGLTAATVALHFRDPHTSGSWGFCPSAALGFWCPGCGGLRAVNDLTNGDVGAALSSNVVVTSLIPVAVGLLALWAFTSWRGTRLSLPWARVRPLVWALVTVLVIFTVMRNTGPGAWLAP